MEALLELGVTLLVGIREAHRAVLGVENYGQFVVALATVVLKHVCSHYPYESRDAQKLVSKRRVRACGNI